MNLDRAREFNQHQATAFAAIMDRENRLPEELIPTLAEAGLLGLRTPKAYGGAAVGSVKTAEILEELSRVAPAIADLVLSVNASTGVLSQCGPPELLERYLPDVVTGKRVPAYALTEPTAGSDLSGIRCRAERPAAAADNRGSQAEFTDPEPEQPGFRLSGGKKLITLARRADFVIALATTNPEAEKPTRGMSLLVTEEFRTGRAVESMGLRGLALGWLSFQKSWVPQENVVGRENEGFYQIMQSLDGGRIEVAAMSVGLAQGALNLALEYVAERKQFGKPLATQQGIQFAVAELQTQVDAARALTYSAARLRDQGAPHSREASEAKLFASETAVRVASGALQLFGGNGYTKEFPVERFFRDARVLTLFEGTSEIQKLVIAKNLFKKR
jgi:alkylation response protein AidB-like acyl-CoA dehydrogenase